MNVKHQSSFIDPELAKIARLSKWEMISTTIAILILGLSFVISREAGRKTSDLLLLS